MTNKDKITETAYELFRSFGYGGTSIGMLIKTAGVSKSNFYYHFESKEELALKILEAHLKHQEKLISEILLDRDSDPLERFVRFYVEGIYAKREVFLQTGSFIAKMALEQGSKNERFRSVIDTFFEKTEAGVEACVQDCEELEVVREGINTKLIPQFLISQFKGAMIMAKVHNSYVPLERSYNKAFDLLIKKEWRHLAPEHDQLPMPAFSYRNQLKPLISS